MRLGADSAVAHHHKRNQAGCYRKILSAGWFVVAAVPRLRDRRNLFGTKAGDPRRGGV